MIVQCSFWFCSQDALDAGRITYRDLVITNSTDAVSTVVEFFPHAFIGVIDAVGAKLL